MDTNIQTTALQHSAGRTKKTISVLIGLISALGIYLFSPLDEPVRAGLAIFTLAGVFWLTEAIPLVFTALLIPVLSSVLHVQPVNVAFSSFAHPIIFIFLGGFALAGALSKYKLDEAIGNRVLKTAGSNASHGAYLLFLATAVLSMWISNTATAAMMLPIALGIANRFDDPNGRTALFLLLGTAYSASIGGIATLVGSPPNAIAAAHQNLSFGEWMQIGLPVTLIILPLSIFLLQLVVRPNLNNLKGGSALSASNLEVSDSMKKGGKKVLAIFATVVVCWIFSKPLGGLIGVTKGFDSLVAVIGILLLGTSGVFDWKSMEKHTNWGILLLFGGGLALGAILKTTGTSAFIASVIQQQLGNLPLIAVVLGIVIFVVFLTELVSNSASAALLIPLFTTVAEQYGIPSVVTATVIAIAASCAFMLPVATPPNAIVYGTGQVPREAMLKAGLVLNVVSTVVLTAGAYLIIIQTS